MANWNILVTVSAPGSYSYFWLLGFEGHGSKLNLEEELYNIKSQSRAM